MRAKLTCKIQGEESVAFQSETGEWFVYVSAFYPRDGELLFSPDGRIFRALAVKGFGGSVCEHGITFVDPHPDRHGCVSLDAHRLERVGDEIVCEGKLYKRSDPPTIDKVLSLPRLRRCEYLFRFEDDGLLLHVGSDEYGYSYESFRLSIGDGVSMRFLPIRKIERYRDGGTTYIVTDEGVLYSPTPFRDNGPARWLVELPAKRHSFDAVIPRGRTLSTVDQNDFDVIDGVASVSVSPKLTSGAGIGIAPNVERK